MKRIILNSITSNQQLSYEEMRKHARSYYLIEHNQQLPELEPKASNHNEVNSVTINLCLQVNQLPMMIGFNC